MKVFPHFNTDDVCPLCGTSEDKPAVLVPIDGTEDGGNEKALQVHLDCLDIRVNQGPFDSELNLLLYQSIVRKPLDCSGLPLDSKIGKIDIR